MESEEEIEFEAVEEETEEIVGSTPQETVNDMLLSNVEVLIDSLHQEPEEKDSGEQFVLDPEDPLLIERKLTRRKIKNPQFQLFKCEFCEFIATSRNQFDIHQAVEHFSAENLELIICELCEEPFLKLSDLDSHTEISHKDGGHLKCSICSASFENYKNFSTHIQSCMEAKTKAKFVNRCLVKVTPPEPEKPKLKPRKSLKAISIVKPSIQSPIKRHIIQNKTYNLLTADVPLLHRKIAIVPFEDGISPKTSKKLTNKPILRKVSFPTKLPRKSKITTVPEQKSSPKKFVLKKVAFPKRAGFMTSQPNTSRR